MKKKGFTIAEVLTAGGIFAFFITSVLGVSVFVNNICNSSIAAFGLQRDATVIVWQIVARDTGENAFVGLRSATGRVDDAAHPTDLVFMGTDGNERRYSATENSILYTSPTIPGGSKTIYTAANGVIVQFSYEVINAKCVKLDLILSQPFSGRVISGSARLVTPLKNVL